MTGNPQAWVRLGVRTGRPFLNFGDELSPLAWTYATGKQVVWAPPHEAQVFGVGSILEFAKASKGSPAIWGTGLRMSIPADDKLANAYERVQCLALRGMATASGLAVANTVPLGDPGLIVSEMTNRKPTRKRYEKVFIPHFRTWATPGGRRALRAMHNNGFRIVEPSRPPLTVAQAIAGAEIVATSSLHGLVFADALGVPVQRITSGAQEPQFKFADYESALGLSSSEMLIDDFIKNPRMLNYGRLEERASKAQNQARILAEKLVAAARSHAI